MGHKLFTLDRIGDLEHGYLSFMEAGKDIPFEVKRAYWIYSVPKDTVRGGHAHRQTQQIFFCLSGEVQHKLEDGRGNIASYFADYPDRGLYVPPMVWHTMRFVMVGTAVLALASSYYSESDYIRDRDEFTRLVHA